MDMRRYSGWQRIEEINQQSSIDESVVHIEMSTQKPDALEQAVDYYLQDNGHLSLKQELLQQGFLFVVAISGASLYAVPADAYAWSEQAELISRINYIISTCVPALAVLWNSTELFLGMRAAEKIPEKLADYLENSFTPQQKIIENIIVTLGSAISAFPLAAVSFLYPIPGLPKGVIILQSIIVEFDNTILHFLPIKLALQNPLYRLPILPFEFIFKQIINCCRSPEERQKNQLQKQIDQYYQFIKQRFITHLDQVERLLSNYGFEFQANCLNYKNYVGKEIEELKQQHAQDPLLLLENLLRLIHERSPKRPIDPPSTADRLLRKLVYIPGAFWVMSSCVGFLVAPINEMTELTGSEVMGASFSAPSVYFLGVLLAYFGGNSLQNTYDYFTSWQDDAVKIPQEFKIYPKTSILLIVISMYLSVFSYAAGAELIKDNFTGDLEFLRPELLALSETGLAFLGFTAMLDFFSSILKKFSHYGRNKDAEMVAKLSAAFSQLKNSIQLMKSDQLIISLSKLEGTRLMSILNIRPSADNNELDELRETLVNLQMALEEKSELNSKPKPAEQQGVHGTPTSPVSPLPSRQRQFRSSDDETSSSEPSLSRRVTRTNSIDTVMTDIHHEHNILKRGICSSDLFIKLTKIKELDEERSAVGKLLNKLPIPIEQLSDNSDLSERSRLIYPCSNLQPFFSRRSMSVSNPENNNSYRYGSISSVHYGETSFSC